MGAGHSGCYLLPKGGAELDTALLASVDIESHSISIAYDKPCIAPLTVDILLFADGNVEKSVGFLLHRNLIMLRQLDYVEIPVSTRKSASHSYISHV